MTETIGFIGLGNMGGPMSRNLLDAGFTVVGSDLDADQLAAFVAAGGIAAVDALDAARQGTIVFTSLPGPKEVEAVGTAMLNVMDLGDVWVDLSTNDLTCARKIEAAAKTAGVDLLDLSLIHI